MERLRQMVKRSKPVKWLFYGDSITHGALHTFGQRDYTQLFSERIRFEMARPSDIVINTAVSGNTTRQLLAEFQWRVERFAPDVVFIMIGMNDCSSGNDITAEEFSRNIDLLCDMVLRLPALPVVQTTCPILPDAAPDREPYFSAYMEICRRVAVSRSLPQIDHEAYWKENAERHFFWMSNAFHPNEYGHRAFARLLFEELQIRAEDSYTCSLFLP